MVYIDKKNNHAIIKVTPDIRESIMKTKKIFLDLESHHVNDSFHVLQCYHCQSYGHKANSENCPKKNLDPTCLYCAESHKSVNCRNKKDKSKQKCRNCLNSKTNSIKEEADNHNSNSKNCPSYLKEVELVKLKTCFDSKNLKNV